MTTKFEEIQRQIRSVQQECGRRSSVLRQLAGEQALKAIMARFNDEDEEDLKARINSIEVESRWVRQALYNSATAKAYDEVIKQFDNAIRMTQGLEDWEPKPTT